MAVEASDSPMEAIYEPKCSPIICPFYHYCGCGWKGPFEDLMPHCTTKHKAYTFKGYKQLYVIEKFRLIKERKDIPHVIEAHGNVFMVWLQKFPSGYLRMRLHSMGCCYDPSRYEGFITFQSYKELSLFCYTAYDYHRGLDRLDDTKVYIDTTPFFVDTQNDLTYTILIKDKSLESYISRIS